MEKGNHPVVKTFSPEGAAGDARFDGKFHRKTKAGWSPCTSWRNLPISSIDHHSLLNQTKCMFPRFAHHIPRAQSGPRQNRAVIFRSGLSGTLGHYSVTLYSWMVSAQKSPGPVLQGESRGIESASGLLRAGTHHRTHLTSSSH